MMNIVYYCSDSFSEICGVAIQSLVENNTESDEIALQLYSLQDVSLAYALSPIFC